MDIIKTLSDEFKIRPDYTANILKLIDEGNTIPFIARYRKEMHGSCDDQVLREMSERLSYLRNLEKRKEEILASITEQGKMTEELEAAISEALTLARLEDIYRPYKQKRRTRATIAKEKGLEPLAVFIRLAPSGAYKEAEKFIDEEKEIFTAEDAICGAKDIIAEAVSDDADIRSDLRAFAADRAYITSKAASEEDSVYSMYYDYSEQAKKMPSHRILAVNRGEKEGFLKVSVDIDEQSAIDILNKKFVTSSGENADIIKDAVLDSYERLIYPSLERAIRSDLTESAQTQAIKNFGINLKQLLMQPPIKGKTVLGFDPAYRTGCKIAVVDKSGNVLDSTVVYPTPPQNKTEEAKDILKKLIKKHGVDVISIGNGTASKESEIFVAELIGEIEEDVKYMVVNEAGASVYSASKLGAEEFPQFDVSIRSAISIARRLQDPLAELVKIDPKSVGVGQYQHDMPPKELSETLGGVVEDSVNSVGVDLNTASVSLLKYVSGLSSQTAANIVSYRNENGEFTSRTQLKNVSKLGPKAYEQCAGFLRIPGAKNVFDNTGVHPESYDAAKTLLSLCGYSRDDVSAMRLTDIKKKISDMGEDKTAEKCLVGVPTLRDIVSELLKPGRDMRDSLPPPLLRSDIMGIDDLYEGMVLKGTVRNVIDFGAFVDIGVHQDGLVHISQITNKYIKHPSEVLKVGDVRDVKIIGIDKAKNRISLSMKDIKS